MTREVGELRVELVDGKPVVRQADPYIYAQRQFLDEHEGTAADGQSFTVGSICYRVLGPVPDEPDCLLCERVA